MITQKQIAEMAGVSRVTVARVLSDSPLVKPDTKAKVMTAIKLLGYEANRSAQALVNQKKKHRIACVYIDFDDAFFHNMHIAFQEMVLKYKSYGLDIDLYQTSNVPEDRLSVLHSLDFNSLSGLICLPLGIKEENDFLHKLHSKGLPVITLHAYTEELHPLCRITNDFQLCGRIAANLFNLITGGHAEIGIISGHNVPAHNDRIDGMRSYIQSYPCMNIRAISHHEDNDILAYTAMQRMLSEYPQINSLFIASGSIYGACQAIIDSGFENKIKVISVDKRKGTYEMMKRNLICATIDQQEKKQVYQAVEVLYNYLFLQQHPKKEILIPLELKLLSNYNN